MVSRLISSNPRFMKMMQREDEPIPISGPKLLPIDRQVIWKKVCIIGELCRECIVEMSHTKTKFYIVSLDLEYNHYSTIEMFRPQATKLIKACASINGAIVFTSSTSRHSAGSTLPKCTPLEP